MSSAKFENLELDKTPELAETGLRKKMVVEGGYR